MQTTTTVCTAPPGIDTTLLQIAAALTGTRLDITPSSSSSCDTNTSDTSSSGGACQFQSTTTHAFTGVVDKFTAVGWVGIVRHLMCSSSRVGGDTAAQQAAVESWLSATEQTILPIVRQDKHDEIFKAVVEDFCEHVEQFLSHQHQTFLVGDHATMADAMTAVALAAAVTALHGLPLPQQVYRWCRNTLDLLVACCGGGGDDPTTITIVKTLQGYQLVPGKASLLELPETTTTTTTTSTTESALPASSTRAAPTTATTTESAAPASIPPAAPAATAVGTTAAASAPASTATAAAMTENAVLQALQKLGVTNLTVYEHVACDTAEDLCAKVPLPSSKHSHTKNLFLKDKKHGSFLVTVRPTAVVNTKTLGQLLKLPGKTNLRLADAAILWEQLRVKPGSVGPLAVLQDGIHVKKTTDTADDDDDDKSAIVVVLDKALVDSTRYDAIHSHPLRNDMSVQLTPALLLQVLQQVGVEPVLLDFPEADGGKAPATRPPPTAAPMQQPDDTKKKEAGAAKPKEAPLDKKKPKKGETLLALQWKKSEHFANWYTDVIVLSEMIAYYDISGCYILRPWSYKIWELVQEWFNEKIQQMGVENAYFPLFVSQERLETEKDHVEGFAPEVAWVTKSGAGDLAKPIAIRPTSETIMYPAFSDWIKSHRDLPLKLNQWSNVVRWEFKYPTPFLRSREFLWQEGHTAHATFADADETVMQALELYRRVYEDLLAVPVVPGYKTEKEKFAGGFRTTTVEAYIAGSGRAIQGATSHNLGQNFGKMFDITFQNEKGEKQEVWQTSWGLTTRTIGVMVMVHGDDTGLVLPPRVAPLQVVIVPILSKHLTIEQAAPYCALILDDLKAAGVRVKLDDRDLYNPGWKYNHWEQKGVPIRIEVGPKDIETKSARIVIRHNGVKEDYPTEGLGQLIKGKLDEIQQAMFAKAKEARDSHVVKVTEWKDFVPNLEKHNLVLTPWCGGQHQDWEDWVKNKSREESLQALGEEAEDDKTSTSVAAKTLCIPFDQPELPAGTKCLASGMDATCWILWGRSY